jgi:hypothetical protein
MEITVKINFDVDDIVEAYKEVGIEPSEKNINNFFRLNINEELNELATRNLRSVVKEELIQTIKVRKDAILNYSENNKYQMIIDFVLINEFRYNKFSYYFRQESGIRLTDSMENKEVKEIIRNNIQEAYVAYKMLKVDLKLNNERR